LGTTTIANAPEVPPTEEGLALVQDNSVSSTNIAFYPKIATYATLSDKYDTVMDIAVVSMQYNISIDKSLKVGVCESGLTQSKIGKAGEIGIYQFMPTTWIWFNQIRHTNLDINNEQDQIDMYAWAIANGYSSHWTCWDLTK
jgi:hypothetical protein